MATTPPPEPPVEPRRGAVADECLRADQEVWEKVKPVHPRSRFRRFGWRLSRPWRGI
jgi:hypothetical protein